MEVSKLKRARREEKNRNRSPSVKARKITAAVCMSIFAAAFIMFTADLIRVKQQELPPLFCVPAIRYENGSEDYYGLFYKVWKDFDPFENKTEYYMSFWFIPKNFSI